MTTDTSNNTSGESGAPGTESAQADPTFRIDGLSGSAAPDAQGRRLSAQTVFIVVLLVATGGVLFGMRQLGFGPTISFADTKIDYTPPARTIDHKKLIEQLTASQVESQVPPEQVQKNPFSMAESLPTNVVLAPTGDPEEDARRAASEANRRAIAQRLGEIEAALASIEINSILGGSNPIARVNGETVRVGDTIAEIFTVQAIQTRSIDLVVDGKTFTISLDDKNEDPRKSQPKSKPGTSKRAK
jgi:hypothetical protein